MTCEGDVFVSKRTGLRLVVDSGRVYKVEGGPEGVRWEMRPEAGVWQSLDDHELNDHYEEVRHEP